MTQTHTLWQVPFAGAQICTHLTILSMQWNDSLNCCCGTCNLRDTQEQERRGLAIATSYATVPTMGVAAALEFTEVPPQSTNHEYCFTEYHLQYNQKGAKKGYRLGSICTCHKAVMKNSEEPNLGDEGQSTLSEQKGTETSSPIRGTVIYNFTIQAFLS